MRGPPACAAMAADQGPAVSAPEGAPFLERLWTRLKLWRCRSVGPGVRALGTLWIHGGGSTIVGANVVLDGRRDPIELHAAAGAVIELGENVTVQGGASIEAVDSVTVGAGSTLGPFVKVIDNNFHPLRGDRNHRPPSSKVRIEDHVRVGARAIILPGAHVQAGAHIGARAVISQRVPRGALVHGNPPRLFTSRGDPP